MAIQTNLMKNILANAYIGTLVSAASRYGAVYTTVPGAAQGTEPAGGSPAYARKILTGWSGPTAGVTSSTAVFDIPTGTTLVGAGIHDAVTAGNYLDGAAVTSQAFSSQGTYSVTFTFTES